MKNDILVQYANANKTMQLISAESHMAQPNSEYEVHTHYDELEIYYFLKGNLFFAFEGSRYNVESGAMIIVANGTIHKPVIKEPCEYIRKRILFDKKIFIDFNSAAFNFYNALRKRKIISVEPQKVKEQRLDVLFNQIEQSLAKGTEHDDFCALIDLFSLLIEAEKNSISYESVSVYPNNAKIARIVEYIEEHISDDLSYQSIAEEFFVTEKNLYRLFKKETGFTLSDYINERRIIKAQSILNAGGNANEAALASGFRYYSVFYRSFLKKVGISPAEYIKNVSK